MGSIHYDPQRILNGFKEDSLQDLAKRLKRRIRVIKSDIIQDILSSPKGKSADTVKVWQEINRSLRKELEAYTQEEIETFSLSSTPQEEQLMVSYMFTLSSNPEIKAIGEKLYCQAQESILQEKEGDEEEGDVKEMIRAENVIEPIFREVKRTIENREFEGMQATTELNNRIKTLDKKLKRTFSEGLRTKGQLEKLKSEWAALRVQLLKEKEDNGRYRNRVQELETELTGKDIEIKMLNKKIEQLQQNNIPQVKAEHNGKIELAAFQGRKALIFAEHDQEVDSRLNALGIIPIWAMEIDWNRPRRRMSTCQVVLYKMHSEKLKKLEEIQEIASYLNIPCSELMDQ